MSAFILHDHYFDPESGRISSYFCRLFILVGQESLQYCILDTEKNTFIALADYRLPVQAKSQEIYYDQLDKLLGDEEKLVKKYSSVVIGLDSQWHTLVPLSLFDPGQVLKYLEFNFSLPENCLVGFDQVSEIDASNIFGYSSGLKDVFSRHYPEAAFVHRSSALLKAVREYSQVDLDQPALYLNSREQYIDLACFDGKDPVFFNSFPCRTKEDVLYFTLYAIEQMKLRPDAVRLIVSGMAEPGSDVYRLLEQYIRTVPMAGWLDSLSYCPLIKQLPANRYQELFALALCGS